MDWLTRVRLLLRRCSSSSSNKHPLHPPQNRTLAGRATAQKLHTLYKRSFSVHELTSELSLTRPIMYADEEYEDRSEKAGDGDHSDGEKETMSKTAMGVIDAKLA
uniref:Uncharacterized protein n=1 Tax=Trichogramma kaykai TaxID=54128 RepID=A0ABD2XNK3_9HYME